MVELKDELVSLTQEDAAVLRSNRNSYVGCFVLFTAIIFAALVDFVFNGINGITFGTVALILNRFAFGLGVLLYPLAWLAALFVISLFAYVSYNFFQNARSDLSGKMKRVIVAPIDDEGVREEKLGKEISFKYWIKVKELKFDIEREVHNRLRKGDMVEIHVAPKSNVLLREVKKINGEN